MPTLTADITFRKIADFGGFDEFAVEMPALFMLDQELRDRAASAFKKDGGEPILTAKAGG